MDTITALACLTLLILIISIQGRRKKIHEPPMVPYKFPIIGHTLEIVKDSRGFLNDCREKYGEIFTIYIFGQVLTITGKELCYELMTSPKMSFAKHFQERVPLFHILGEYRTFDGVLADIVRGSLTRLDKFHSRVQQSLQEGLDELLGDCDEPKTIKDPINVFREIISRPIANIYLGEDPSHDKEIIETFKTFTADVINTVRTRLLPDMIHPWLGKQWILMRLKLGHNPVRKHQEVIMNCIKPIVEKRIEESKRLGDKWKAPDDLLQDLIDHPLNNKENPDFHWLTTCLLTLVWVAIHTTSTHATDILQVYAGRPEYWQELLDEQLEIAGDDPNLELTIEQLNKMVKLDAFAKESIRSFGHIVALIHKTMVPVFTFSNGYQVPEGRSVGVYMDTLNAHLGEFDGRRYVGQDSPASRIGRDFVPFGLGKHACPGRFLAINEIKTLMSKVIRRYKVTTESGKLPTKQYKYIISLGSKEGLVFEKRHR